MNLDLNNLHRAYLYLFFFPCTSHRPKRTRVQPRRQEHSHLCPKVNVLTKPLRFNAKHGQPIALSLYLSLSPCGCSISRKKDAGPPSCTSCTGFLFASVYEKKRGRICKDTAFRKISVQCWHTHTRTNTHTMITAVELNMKAHDARRQLNVIDERLLGREVISSTELLIHERTLCEQTCFWRPRLFICISAPVLQNTDTISLSLSLFLAFFSFLK